MESSACTKSYLKAFRYYEVERGLQLKTTGSMLWPGPSLFSISISLLTFYMLTDFLRQIAFPHFFPFIPASRTFLPSLLFFQIKITKKKSVRNATRSLELWHTAYSIKFKCCCIYSFLFFPSPTHGFWGMNFHFPENILSSNAHSNHLSKSNSNSTFFKRRLSWLFRSL